MTWLKVLIFSVLSAVLTAAVLVIPGIKDTSVSQIGVSFECWVLFALIIIMNCEKPLEAGLKTFVFFLVSQPIIYLLQVPFSWQGWGLFRYYPGWFFLTLLCFPGAMLAWFVKKDNLFSSIILSVATGFLAVISVDYLSMLTAKFPSYLISFVFTTLLAFVLIFALLKKKANRIIALVITLVCAVVSCFFAFSKPVMSAATSYYLDDAHTWEVIEDAGNVAEVIPDPDVAGAILVSSNEFGSENFTVRNELGEEITFSVTYDDKNVLSVEMVDE